MRKLTIFLFACVLITGCGGRGGSSESSEESREAKAMFQGVWLDEESGDVTFRVKGDTIFYADSTSMPAYFKIVKDSLVLASGTKYGISKQTEHLFWFTNQSGDIVKLVKSDDADDEIRFSQSRNLVSQTRRTQVGCSCKNGRALKKFSSIHGQHIFADKDTKKLTIKRQDADNNLT